MYFRELKKSPNKIVCSGKINFGTFKGVAKKLDIRGVKAPFAGVPTSRFFSNFRIKSGLAYYFCTDKYIGMIDFFDNKIFGLSEVVFWSRETGQRFAYHNFMGPRKRFIPVDTSEGACSSFGKTRYMKIYWSRKHKKIVASFILKGDKFRPATKGKFISRFVEEEDSEILIIRPAPTTQRCSASWILPLNMTGGLSQAKHRNQIKELPQEKGQALLFVKRMYLKFHLHSEVLNGFFELNNKKISFSFSETTQDAIDDDNYNDNILSVDEQITAMPPVCITHPFGIDKKWIIQDMENMVDLTFTPNSVCNRVLNIIIMRKAYSVICGTFEGVLLSKDGEKIILKNCPGIAKKSTLRL